LFVGRGPAAGDFYINKKSYSNRIRFILTLDPENLTSLFTRRWF
jgi:hypothetical protein